MSSTAGPKEENIRVAIRCRPLSKDEEETGYKPIVEMNPEKRIVTLKRESKDSEPKSFQFNSVYPWTVEQQFIYDDAARPVVDAVLQGFNGTVFAYGQTGTGKTYTMEGVPDDEVQKGIIPHAFDHIFAHISKVKDRTFLVRASYLQIYMEDVFDLLADPHKRLHVRQLKDDITVVGLSSHIVKSPEEIQHLLMRGKSNRVVRETKMNKTSSRSHSVFTIIVEQRSDEIGTLMGKLHLVDLAGSERLKKTQAEGEAAKQGAKINASLLALGNVISALVTNQKHVPYRDSKLTQLLQDSIGGNSKTVMVTAIGPASYNYDETLSSLYFSSRAKDIKNIPKINVDPKDALLNDLREKINKMKRELEERNRLRALGALNRSLSELEAEHNKNLEDLMANKDISEEEKRTKKAELIAEFERQKEDLIRSTDLAHKIQQMEDSVLVGGMNLLDTAKQQEEELRAYQSRIRQEQEQQRKLDEFKKKQDEQTLIAENKYTSLQEELQEKTKKIEKLKPLIKHLEEKIDDLQNQFEREREEQVSYIQDISKELEMQQFIADCFIPERYQKIILDMMTYDEVNQRWTVPDIELAGKHIQVEEEEPEEQHIFFTELYTPSVTSDVSLAAVKKRTTIAKSLALNEFALISGMGIKEQ